MQAENLVTLCNISTITKDPLGTWLTVYVLEMLLDHLNVARNLLPCTLLATKHPELPADQLISS
jgi:hypothetical protein